LREKTWQARFARVPIGAFGSASHSIFASEQCGSAALPAARYLR
jgi:hypothetical protein